MIKTKHTLLIIFAVLSLSSHAQKIKYTYSPSGNRTQRTFDASPFRIGNKDSTESAKEFPKVLMQEGLSVYPNPTKDVVVVTISNYDPEEKNYLSLLDGKGNEILSQPIATPKTEFNVAHVKSGIYYFKVVKGKNILYYKLVKID